VSNRTLHNSGPRRYAGPLIRQLLCSVVYTKSSRFRAPVGAECRDAERPAASEDRCRDANRTN